MVRYGVQRRHCRMLGDVAQPDGDAYKALVKRACADLRRKIDREIPDWDPRKVYDLIVRVVWKGSIPTSAEFGYVGYLEDPYLFDPVEGRAGRTIAPLERECFRFDSLVINPWMGKPGNEDRLLRTILHESGHVAVKQDGYTGGGPTGHGPVYRAYIKKASYRAGMKIPIEMPPDYALFLKHFPPPEKGLNHEGWVAHWDAQRRNQ